jgi:copper chaperone CopZ
MMRTTLFSPDIECDSCVKLINKAFSKHGGISAHKVHGDTIEVEHDEKTTPADIIKAVRAKGFRASLDPYLRMPMTDRIADFFKNRKQYHVEWQMLRTVSITLLLLLTLQAVFAYFMQQTEPTFIALYGWWLFYLTLSVVAVGGALWHYKAYRVHMTCMVGMMIGMTIGMQTGMMIGAILGATNGFFVGALVGMLLAAIVGAWAGNCCGVMGVMEGLMAGIMGGTMGAMISVMMWPEGYLLWFMPIYMLLNLLVLGGFSLMLFEEVAEGKEVAKRPLPLGRFLALAAGALVALTALMLLAPKSIFLG